MAEPSTRLQTVFGETPKTEYGKSFREAMGLREPYIQQIGAAKQDLVKAEGDVLQAQQRQLEQKAAGETAAKMQYAQDESAAQEAYKEAKAAEPIPAFIPTRDNAEDLAKLFSFIGVMGTFLGRGGGKQAAMGAMAGMTGMMEGWRQGRMDLYNQEKVKFEKDFARVNKIHQDLAKDLDNALRTAATNKEVGLSMAHEAAVRAGSDIVRQTIATKGIAASVELAKEISASAEQVIADVNRMETEARRNRATVEAAAIRAGAVKPTKPDIWMLPDGTFIDANKEPNGVPPKGARRPSAVSSEELARLKADLKGGKEPPLAIQNKNDLRNTLIPKIEEAIPVMDRLHKEKKWNDLTILLGMPYGTNLAEVAFKDDPEALNLILTLAYFRSKEFETAGKALTKKEDQILAPIYRSDFRAYEGIRNSLVQAQKMLTEERKAIEANYPWVRAYNRSLRGEPAEDDETPVTPSGAPSATPKAQPAATSGTGKKRAVSDVEVKAYADKHGLTPEQARKVLTNMGYQ